MNIKIMDLQMLQKVLKWTVQNLIVLVIEIFLYTFTKTKGGLNIVFLVEELTNLIAHLYKINLLAAANSVISNLMHFKNEVELLMKTEVRNAFALQAN